MVTDLGQNGALVLGGRLFGSPLLNGALNAGETTMSIDGVTLVGIVAVGDTFTIAGESGTPTHTVTGGPFYVSFENAVPNIAFSTVIAAGGAADDAAVTFANNSMGELRTWTIDEAGLEMMDDTVKGDTHRTFKGGLSGFSGSASALLDYDDAQQKELIDLIATGSPDGLIASLIFETAPTRFFYGGAVLRSFVTGSEEGSPVLIGFTFQGTGQMLLSIGGAFDSCNAANGTRFGVSKPNLPPTRIPEFGFGGWIVDTPTAYEIQGNLAEQQAGHAGGAGGKYCINDVAADSFTYSVDIVQGDPAITGMGLGFRYEENPEDGTAGNFWEQKADGLSVEMSSSASSVVSLKFVKRLAGAQQGTFIATGVATPFRMVLVVSGSSLDVYSEPIGGGIRTLLAGSVDLTQNLGTTDDFNDETHQRFGLVSGSNPDIGSTFNNITVILNA